MPYADNFTHADDLVAHLDTIVPTINDPILKAKYVGFLSVAAVTVYELALKEIFVEFARQKHQVFGNFAESYFRRINGRIRVDVIKDEYIPRFGSKYQKRFQRKIEKVVSDFLRSKRRDPRAAYGNLITWRNEFAHEGKINKTATYTEAAQAYEDGKEVIHTLAAVMNR